MDPLEPREAAEIERLTIAKLNLEVRDLSLAWWKRPSYLASLASVTAAVLGVLWGISTGFFDVSRRELDVRRRELLMDTAELRSLKDRMSVEFMRQKKRQETEIALLTRREHELSSQLTKVAESRDRTQRDYQRQSDRLVSLTHHEEALQATVKVVSASRDKVANDLVREQAHVEELRRTAALLRQSETTLLARAQQLDSRVEELEARVHDVDIPLLLSVQEFHGPWDNTKLDDITCSIKARNIRNAPGLVQLTFQLEPLTSPLTDEQARGVRSLLMLDGEILAWTDDTLRATFKRPRLAHDIEALVREVALPGEHVFYYNRHVYINPGGVGDYNFVAYLNIIRADRRESNRIKIVLNGAAKWARSVIQSQRGK